MIADIYYCPYCGTDVYLTPGEEYCPLCNREGVELVERDVDLEQDAKRGEESEYANFGHLTKVLNALCGDKAGLYLMDSWKYAWDATETDSVNIDRLAAFVEDPNGFVLKKRTTPMTKEELHAEIERITRVILSKCKFPRNPETATRNLFGFERKNPVVRFFVKKDFTYVAAEACFSHARTTFIYNYSPIEKDRPTPKTWDGYFVFFTKFETDTNQKKYFRKVPYKTAKKIVRFCSRDPKSFYWVIRKWRRIINYTNNEKCETICVGPKV